LLALIYPEEFGTVDVMVTKALQRIGLPHGNGGKPEKPFDCRRRTSN
jgi:hypothetical protein